MSSSPDILALVCSDGDSYELHLENIQEKSLVLARVLRYENNQNRDPVSVRFLDLPRETRDAILQQIRRRHPHATVKI